KERNYALQQEETTRQSLYAADVYLAQQALAAGNLGRARAAIEAHFPAPGRKDLRGFEWYYLWARCQGDQVATLSGHHGGVACVAFSPDGQWLASGGDDRTVRVWNVRTWQEKLGLPPFEEPIVAVRFSPDNRHLWVGTANAQVSVWDLERRTKLSSVSEKGGD